MSETCASSCMMKMPMATIAMIITSIITMWGLAIMMTTMLMIATVAVVIVVVRTVMVGSKKRLASGTSGCMHAAQAPYWICFRVCHGGLSAPGGQAHLKEGTKRGDLERLFLTTAFGRIRTSTSSMSSGIFCEGPSQRLQALWRLPALSKRLLVVGVELPGRRWLLALASLNPKPETLNPKPQTLNPNP